VYDKVFYSLTAREIILEKDKTACRFVFSYWTWTWTCPFKVDLDLDLDLAVAGLVTSLSKCLDKIWLLVKYSLLVVM